MQLHCTDPSEYIENAHLPITEFKEVTQQGMTEDNDEALLYTEMKGQQRG